MANVPVHEWTLLEAARKVREKQISSRELTGALLARIEALDPKVRAYVTVLPEAAAAQAAACDEEQAKGSLRGPLHGVPIGLKDIFCTRGVRTTCGSRILRDFLPPYDACVTERVLAAGAVLLGKHNMDEFAMGSSTETSFFGPTRNPWDLSRIPGGSSGGTAAAVASAMCFSGVKPTYGRVSRYGMIAFASSLDQGGPIARTVADAAALLGVIAGHDRRDSTCVDIPVPDYLAAVERPVKGLRIGLPKEYYEGDGLSPEVRAAVENALKALTDQGAEVVDVSLPHTSFALSTYYLVAPAEASSNLARYDGVRYGYRAEGASGLIEMMSRTRAEGFGDEVKRRIMIGTYALSAGYYDAFYGKAQKVRTLIRDDFTRAFEAADVLLTPTAPTPAFRLGEKTGDPLTMYLSDIYTIPCNLAGIPGISVPCGFSSEGLPIGAQLLSEPFREETLFTAAGAVERALPLRRVAPLEG
jgi:aspartyl-tRNA(Asn)/glutamyl-tRNA(Gln) amidotransferase subunit A